MRTRPLLVATTLVLTSVLAACGSSGSTTPVAAPDTAVSQAPAADAAASSTPAATADGTRPAAAQDPIAPENSPPGDIPDNLAFVAYSNSTGKYSFTHPEGWAETAKGATVTFTDKLNGVYVEPGPLTKAPTVAEAKKSEVPALKTAQAAFELRSVAAATVKGASGVKIVYRRNSAPDPVTGRQYRDEVERYSLVKNGREIIIELYGPVGSDNVDAYKTMIDSLKFA
jgi:hypothetical protein